MDGRVVLGDVVVAIDGEWMQGMGFDVLKERIVGNIGTFVNLTFESVRYTSPRSPFYSKYSSPFTPPILHPSHFVSRTFTATARTAPTLHRFSAEARGLIKLLTTMPTGAKLKR